MSITHQLGAFVKLGEVPKLRNYYGLMDYSAVSGWILGFDAGFEIGNSVPIFSDQEKVIP